MIKIAATYLQMQTKLHLTYRIYFNPNIYYMKYNTKDNFLRSECHIGLQCFDAVGCAAGRASGL